MVNVGVIANGIKNFAGIAGKTIGKVATSEAAKKLSLSAAVGAVGVLGQKGCEKMIAAGEKGCKKAKQKEELRRERAREENIRSWAGFSAEDMI